jgi:hypothetical protein
VTQSFEEVLLPFPELQTETAFTCIPQTTNHLASWSRLKYGRLSHAYFTHEQMFHLGQAKVTERLLRGYYWPTLRVDVRRWLHNCPDCEIEKARQNQAHGLFRARPYDAPRTRFAMDFQGQGLATTGENEALAIIDTTTRYVTVLAMKGRETTTLVPLFLDNVVFQHGAPRFLHCDEAPEFMSALVKELLAVTETVLTTTLAHNARRMAWWKFSGASGTAACDSSRMSSTRNGPNTALGSCSLTIQLLTSLWDRCRPSSFTSVVD